MRSNKKESNIISHKISPGIIKWIYLPVFLLALAGFLIPWVKLTVPETGTAPAREYAISVVKLIEQSQDYSYKYNLGVFSGLNQLSSVTLFYAIPVLVSLSILLLLTKNSLVRRTFNWFLASILVISPVYTHVILKNAIPNIIDVTSAALGPGAFLCGLAGLALVVLLLIDREEKALSTDIFEENEKKLLVLYSILSVFSLVSMWLPFIRLYSPSGLKSTQVYSVSLAEFIRISPEVKVLSFFSRSGAETGFGISAVLYAIPIASIVIIAGLYFKKRRIRRAAALINAVFLIAASSGIPSVLSDSIANFPEMSRISMNVGALLMFSAGICYLCAFVMDRPIKLTNTVEKSAVNHHISYIMLSIMACLVFILPWSELSAPVVNSLGILKNPAPEGIAWPVNAITIIKLINNPAFYLLYLIPVLSAITVVSVALNLRGLSKIISGANALILIAGPVGVYAGLEGMYRSAGPVKLRFATILTIAVGICLLVTLLTDRREAYALKVVWHKVKKTFEIILTALFAVVQLYPLVWLLLASFKNNNEIFSGKVLALPSTWHFENYSRVLFGAQADETVSQAIQRAMTRQKDMTLFKFIISGGSEGNILRYFLNSAFVVLVTVAAVILFGSMASYAISRIKWKRSALVYTFFILGMMIPVHVALSPLYVAFAGMGLIDSLWSLIIPYIGFGLPISIIVICGFMESIPYEIEESARIDGASMFTVFFKIIVPMVMPAISTVLIFVFLQSWNELMFATSFITSGVNRTITVGINSIAISQYNTEYALIFAGLVIASLPTIIIYLAGSQQVQKSLIVGAIKG